MNDLVCRSRLEPTPMGERILAFMNANCITNMEEFAEGILGIPVRAFRSWLYERVDPESLPVKPIVLCADALGTNAEYLTCMSDDPRPGVMLTYDESVLLQSFRDIWDPKVRESLLREAYRLSATSQRPAHHNSPFPGATRRRGPPANEAS